MRFLAMFALVGCLISASYADVRSARVKKLSDEYVRWVRQLQTDQNRCANPKLPRMHGVGGYSAPDQRTAIEHAVSRICSRWCNSDPNCRQTAHLLVLSGISVSCSHTNFGRLVKDIAQSGTHDLRYGAACAVSMWSQRPGFYRLAMDWLSREPSPEIREVLLRAVEDRLRREPVLFTAILADAAGKLPPEGWPIRAT